jgi:hypothetical protein
MPFAIELFLDETADSSVRQIWAALDDHIITSLGRIPNSDYHPHISLTVFDSGDTQRVAETLRPVLESSVGLPLPLVALVVFLTEEAPAFPGVVPKYQLLTLHQEVHAAVPPQVEGTWPYYAPDCLVPHCTLATAGTDRRRVIEVVSRSVLPINARASSAHLVAIPGGHARTRLA